MGDSLVQQWSTRGTWSRWVSCPRTWTAVKACPKRAMWPSPQTFSTPFSPVFGPFACAHACVVRDERDWRAHARRGEAHARAALRGSRRRNRSKMYKTTSLPCPILNVSTPVRAIPSELPLLRRSSSCKRPDRRNPRLQTPARNAHKMSMERRKQHRHDAPPSWIDPTQECARALAVESHLPRAATPTEGPIYAENPGRKARREDGVERHQAMRGHEAALLQRIPGN